VARSGGFNAPDKFYCSELVLEAYRLAGLPLIAGSPGTSDPNQIVQAYHNGTLEYVGHLKA
jgi:hypothetical protein